jgi:hypothetical protein
MAYQHGCVRDWSRAACATFDEDAGAISISTWESIEAIIFIHVHSDIQNDGFIDDDLFNDIDSRDIAAFYDGEAAAIVVVVEVAGCFESFFKAITETFVVSMVISFCIVVAVRVPTDVLAVVEPSDCMSFVMDIGERQPNPAVNSVISPNAMVIREPTPWVIGNPSPTVVVVP